MDVTKDVNQNVKAPNNGGSTPESMDTGELVTVSTDTPTKLGDGEIDGEKKVFSDLSPVSVDKPELTLLKFAEGATLKSTTERLEFTELTRVSFEEQKVTPTKLSLDRSLSRERPLLSPLSFAFEKRLSATKYPKKMSELEVVDCESDEDNETDSQGTSGGEKSKSSLGWEIFGKKVEEEERKKKKVYMIRSTDPKKKYMALSKKQPIIRQTCKRIANEDKTDDSKEDDDDEEDDELDVVGVLDEEISDIRAPPSLPPQRPQSSRFEKQRLKKDLANIRKSQNNNDSDDESYYRKRARIGSSPPPCLERQTGEEASTSRSETNNIMKRFDKVSPSQMLKTKFSSSQFPTLPLSKKIMEQNKAAHEKSLPNTVIKKVIATRKNVTSVAPKMLQIPAYSDRSTITCYTNGEKTKFPRLPPLNTTMTSRDFPANGCYRCSDNSYFHVDMSTFKFMEDTTAISVRAHLCDQTRVMIARTALWNREYARKLGDRSVGTIWQKPDEVTAQQTGFCSATVRRCIEIANMSMVPKCAERTGVSNNELSSLQTAFSEDAKFCGQKMRNPHVLNQYYHMKQNAATERANDIIAKAAQETAKQMKASSITAPLENKSNASNELTPPPTKRTITEKPGPSSNQPLKRPILRWPGSPSTIPPKNTTAAVASTTNAEKIVIPTRPPPPTPSVVKKSLPHIIVKATGRILPPISLLTAKSDSSSSSSSLKRGRGRPKKVRDMEDEVKVEEFDSDSVIREKIKKTVKKAEDKITKKLVSKKLMKRINQFNRTPQDRDDVSAIVKLLVDRTVHNVTQTPTSSSS